MNSPSTKKPIDCPVCGERSSECKAYDHLRRQLATEKDPARLASLRARHDRMNEKTPEYPPISRMAMNAIEAAGKFVASGGKLVDDAEKARRLDICKSCNYFNPKHVRCRKCGCRISLKARIESSHCPINKW